MTNLELMVHQGRNRPSEVDLSTTDGAVVFRQDETGVTEIEIFFPASAGPDKPTVSNAFLVTAALPWMIANYPDRIETLMPMMHEFLKFIGITTKDLSRN